MTAKELIEELQSMPQDAEVRGEIKVVDGAWVFIEIIMD